MTDSGTNPPLTGSVPAAAASFVRKGCEGNSYLSAGRRLPFRLRQGHQPQPGRARQRGLARIKRQEPRQSKFKRTGHVQHVERAASQRGRVLAAEVGGTLQRGAPQQIGGGVASRRDILVERGQRIVLCGGADRAPKRRQADAVYDLCAPMQRKDESATSPAAPGIQGGRYPSGQSRKRQDES